MSDIRKWLIEAERRFLEGEMDAREIDMRDRSRVFQAGYDGSCDECGDLIVEGDRVRYVEGDLIHEECDTLEGEE